MTSPSRRRLTLTTLVAAFVLLAALGSRADTVEAVLTHAQSPITEDEIWVLVDDHAATLIVYRGSTEIKRFFPVSLGRGGAKSARLRGDNVTPLGEFRVNHFNHESQWHIFIGIDYPTRLHAQMALAAGVFTEQDYEAYHAYYRRHGHPPQDTVLGGGIGIHGIGRGSPDVHSRFHWTEGCVAVTNEQIEHLAELVNIGTRVVIR